MKANLGRDCLRPPLGAVNVRAVQQGLETEGLGGCFVLHAVAGKCSVMALGVAAAS